MFNKEELMAKAKKPAEDAMKLHPFYKGKIQTALKCPVRDVNDFVIWYTPGVAAPCEAIKEDINLSYEYTNRANTVAIVSDGTRVLGLGDIGPEAGMPVMEGKALLFKYLGGVDAVPLCLDTKDPEKIIETVRLIAPSFGAINLEDISQPKCFYILDELRKDCKIPVWHDDQQGTAAINLAGLYSALKIVRKKIEEIRVGFFGAGAACIATARILISAGVKPENIIMADIKGTLHKGRADLQGSFEAKQWHFAQITNPEGIVGGPEEVFKGSDVVYCYSKPGPDTVKKEWVSTMAKDAVLFAGANPIPEIWPWDAKEAGARIVATGRSDFPNQVNNSLGFPGIFRGTLDVQATTITDEMCIAAAQALSKFAERGLSEDSLIPTMDEFGVYPEVATAVGMKAIEQGVARKTMSRDELFAMAKEKIEYAHNMTKCLTDNKFIKLP